MVIIDIIMQLGFEKNAFMINSELLKFKNMNWLANWNVNQLKNTY
jgi:hypothetical protein